MPTITVLLTGDAAERLERLMRYQARESPAHAVELALAALEADATPELEGWLRTVVMNRVAALDADPGSAFKIEDVRTKLFRPV